MSRFSVLLTTSVLVLALTPAASAFTISSDQDVDSGGNIVGAGAGNTITPTGADPNWTYDWAGVTTPGLSLGAYKLVGNDNDGVQGTLTLDLNGGDISGDDGVAIQTYFSVGRPHHADNVTIANAGTIAMGSVDLHADNGSNWQTPTADSGHLTVTASGAVRIQSINTRNGNTTLTRGLGNAGNVSITSGGDVKIEDSTGTAGNIDTYGYSLSAGDLAVSHEGAFVAGQINTYVGGYWTAGGDGGHVTLDGDKDGNGASGSCTTGSIDTAHKRTWYGDFSGNITISGYTNVMVGSLTTRFNGTDEWNNYTGYVEITGIEGDITVNGPIDCERLNRATDDRDGHVELLTTVGSGGTVTLGQLDCSLVRFASLTSDSQTSVVTGDLTNFDIGTNSKVRTPASDKVTYDPFRAANAYLGFGTYGLPQPDGSAGGGVLTPAAVSHTWRGDDPGAVWNADQFDDATTNAPTGAREVATFGDGATTTNVSVEVGSGAGPTVGAIRLEGGTSYNLNAGGGTITMDSNAPGDPGTIVAASAAVDHTIAAPMALKSDLNIDVQTAGRKLTISGAISGAQSVTVKGPGVVVLSGSSDYSGGTTGEAGQLMLGADVPAAGNSPVGTGTLTLDGGTLGASGTRTLSRALVLSADSKLGGTGNGDLTISGNVSGAYKLTMDGDGTATLSGTNSHGDTAVSSGALKLGSAGALGNGNATVDGGQLDLDAAVAAGALTVNNGTMNVNVASSANTLDVKGGVVNLNGVDLNVGTMNVSGGTINAGNSVVLSNQLKLDVGTYSIDAGNTFKAGGTITKDGAGKITLMGGTLTAITVPPPPAGASAYYSFNDPGNPGNDDSGNAHQGALSGGAVYTAAGKADGGLSTLSSGSMMQVNPVVDIGNEWTFGAWFNTLAPVGSWRTLIRGNAGDHQIIVESSSTRLGMYSSANGAFRPSGYNMGLPAGEWHHIAAVGVGGTLGNIQYYIDGQPVGTTDRSSSTDIFAIGNYQGGGQRFANTIDEVYVYGRALVADEVAALFLSAGGGAGGPALFNALAGTGTVVGDIRINGSVEPGLSCDTLNVIGDFTLAAGAMYEWELGDGESDLIAVDGDLTLEDGWGLWLLDAGVGTASGDFLLFTYTGAALVGGVVFDPASDWDTAGLGILDDGAGNVYLTGLRTGTEPVPEPAGLSLVGLALLGLRRRRR